MNMNKISPWRHYSSLEISQVVCQLGYLRGVPVSVDDRTLQRDLKSGLNILPFPWIIDNRKVIQEAVGGVSFKELQDLNQVSSVSLFVTSLTALLNRRAL